MSVSIAASLAESGLPLQGSLELDALDAGVHTALTDGGHDLARFASLLFFGQGGPTLYERHVNMVRHRPDPFDETSARLVTEWHRTTHPDAAFEIVVPGEAILPLGRLAETLGWGKASPLGLTINPTFGLWIAHRVVALSELVFPPPPGTSHHPCESCADTPCVNACPVGAVSLTSGFDIEVCSRHRVTSESPCALQCLARNACPVGAEHRYGPEQMRHHYSAGLASIRRWLDGPRGAA